MVPVPAALEEAMSGLRCSRGPRVKREGPADNDWR